LQDLNEGGLPEMSKNRYAELKALTSGEFKDMLKTFNIKLITYRELIEKVGVEQQQRPGVEY
jgi:hypothetical protein